MHIGWHTFFKIFNRLPHSRFQVFATFQVALYVTSIYLWIDFQSLLVSKYKVYVLMKKKLFQTFLEECMPYRVPSPLTSKICQVVHYCRCRIWHTDQKYNCIIIPYYKDNKFFQRVVIHSSETLSCLFSIFLCSTVHEWTASTMFGYMYNTKILIMSF